jgi:5-hydroxyisourate hydrolase-like protein (transthyretin family)
VDGVYLTAFIDRMANTTAGATSDFDGNYILDGVDIGDLTLSARKQGWITKEKAVTTSAGEDMHADLELDHGHELSGRVIDRDGHPVDSAQVVVHAPAARAVRASATTDADGTFSLSGLADGPVSLSAVHQGYVTATMDNVDPAQAVTITLDRGGAITGRVTGLSDADIAGVNVAANYGTGTTQARVDSDGKFTISGVPDGTVFVSAIKTGPQMRRSTPKSVTVANGTAPFVEVDFAEGIAVSGRVTREGKPVAGGGISFGGTKGERGGSAMLGPDGSYQVNGLETGEYRVYVNLSGVMGGSKLPNVTVTGSMTQDFDVTGSTLRGRVLDASTGAPLSEVTVQLRPVNMQAGTIHQAGTDSDGRFSMELLDDGQYHLATQRSQYAPLQQDVTVPSQDVELRLNATAPTTVRVVDGVTGQAMTADITVVDPTSKSPLAHGRATADLDAKLFLADGHYTLNVGAPGYIAASRDLTVPSPAVVITLQAGGTITFGFHGSEPRYLVQVLEHGQPFRTEMAGPLRNSLTGVAPGSYTVVVTSTDGKTAHGSYPVTVQAGQTAFVEVP